MYAYFKYIVLFFCFFNPYGAANAEISLGSVLEPKTRYESVDFLGAGPLLHPLMLRESLAKSDTINKYVVLGVYFNEKYPNKIFETDLTQDLEIIFPNLSMQEIYDTADNIKKVIRLYHFGKQKYKEVVQKVVAPKDPPLIVEDDQYVVLGDRDYIPVEDGKYAVISDFKKVIGYNNNLREIQAIKDKAKRDIEKKKKKTDFEKFQLMYDKIEISKIFDYGVTIPNPFIGDAGRGDWTEAEGYKARLISTLERFVDTKEFLVALQITVPEAHFMLAAPFDNLSKPEIILKDMQNIASYEVFYPLPMQLKAQELVAAYKGNFAFPVKIRIEDEKKPAFFTADISFKDCQEGMNCKDLSLSPSILIENDPFGEETKSSWAPFIWQSFYNLPPAQNDRFILERADYDASNHLLYLDFWYDTTFKKFALSVENDAATVFKIKKQIITDAHVYVTLEAVKNYDHLEKAKLTFNARLNNYTSLRQTLDMSALDKIERRAKARFVFLSGLLLGIFFYLTPFGLPLLLKKYSTQIAVDKMYIAQVCAKIFGLACAAMVAVISLHVNKSLIYTSLKDSLFYLAVGVFIFLIWFIKPDFEHKKSYFYAVVYGLIESAWCVFFMLFAITPFYEQFSLVLQKATPAQLSEAFFALVLGLSLPDIWYFAFYKRTLPANVIAMIGFFYRMMLAIGAGLCLIYIIQNIYVAGIFGFIIVFVWMLLGFIVFKILLAFWAAVYQTNLKFSQIRATEYALALLLLGAILGFAKAVSFIDKNVYATTQRLDYAMIESQIKEGRGVLVALEPKSCLTCLYNRLTLLNDYRRNDLLKSYNLEYIPVNAAQMTPQIQAYLQEFNRTQAPLYVFYSPAAPNGVVFGKRLKEYAVQKMLKKFVE